MPAPEISDDKLKETVECFEKNKGRTRIVAQELKLDGFGHLEELFILDI